MFRNWQYRLLALVLALGCWYVVTGREKVQSWIEMPVEIVGAAQDIMILDGMQTKIAVRVRGPRALVRGLEEKRPVYTLDLSDLGPGETTIPFEAQNIPLSMALDVVEIAPPSMTLTADRLISRTLPVRPVFEADPGDDLTLVNATSVPPEATLAGPETVLSAIKDVPTRSVTVPVKGPGIFDMRAELDLPRAVTADPPAVRVNLDYAVKLKTVWIKLPVKILPENGQGATVRPTTVQIRCGVPLPLLREENFRDRFMAYVLLPSNLEAGRHTLPLRLNLPKGCALEKTVPEELEVRVKKK